MPNCREVKLNDIKYELHPVCVYPKVVKLNDTRTAVKKVLYFYYMIYILTVN
jgi:hypothetical protein